MKKLLVFLAIVCAPPLMAAPIPITGTIRTPQGNLLNGSLRMILSYSAAHDSCANNIIVAQTVTWRVLNGTLPANAQLVGNDCLQPGNTWYTAQYLTAAGQLIGQNNFYVQGGSFNLSTATPTPVTTNNLSFNISSGFGCPCTTGGIVYASGSNTISNASTLVWDNSTQYLEIQGTMADSGLELLNNAGQSITLSTANGVTIIAGAATSSVFPLMVRNANGVEVFSVDGTGLATLPLKPLPVTSGGTGNSSAFVSNRMVFANSTSSLTTASNGNGQVDYNPTTGLFAVINNTGNDAAQFSNTLASSGSNFGVEIFAGTNASDYALNITNFNGSANLFKIDGFGGVFIENSGLAIGANANKSLGSINASAYWAAGVQGLAFTATMRDSAGTGTCTITFSQGLATATTC